jgi:hypothetical protein
MFNDLTGKRFGKLTVIERAENNTNDKYVHWLCKCDCGNTKVICSSYLTRGATKTCGQCSKRTPNKIILKDNYAELVVKCNSETLLVKISLEDVEKVKLGRWWATKKGQNWYFYSDDVAGYKKISLHRYIMDNPEGLIVDHINTYDHLDNRRSNLRVCTLRENAENQRLSTTNKLGIKNITWNKQNQKWRFYRKINGIYKTIQHKDLNELIRLKKEFLESVGIDENY